LLEILRQDNRENEKNNVFSHIPTSGIDLVSSQQQQAHAPYSIPYFALYGESSDSLQPDFTHVEDIHERSARNLWEIKPHRHAHLIQILCITSGRAETRMEALNTVVEGACVMMIPPGAVHGFRFSPDTQGKVFSIATHFIDHHPNAQLAAIMTDLLARPRIIQLDKQDREQAMLVKWLQAIRQEQESSQPETQLAVSALAELVMVTFWRIQQKQDQKQAFPEGGATLVQQYINLLELHYREQPLISELAAELQVSVSTLNRACRLVTGNSAKKLLMQRLHSEARRRLVYTRETLDQIGMNLGYRDAAYFSKVFRQLEGKTTGAYRADVARQWVKSQ
jgi:AraC family transcriptional activator of pobA